MKALYSLGMSYAFSCRIPKKSGKGYLKQAIGGHHFTDDTKRFYDAMHDAKRKHRDETDLDGYLHIPQDPYLSTAGRLKDAELLKTVLSKTFPRIKEWQEVDLKELFEA